MYIDEMHGSWEHIHGEVEEEILVRDCRIYTDACVTKTCYYTRYTHC